MHSELQCNVGMNCVLPNFVADTLLIGSCMQNNMHMHRMSQQACTPVCSLQSGGKPFKMLLLIMQLPGANAGKPDVGGAAKDAAKKTPFGFMNMGDLAFDLPGSNVSKDDLPNNVKPGDAAGLPKGPTAKPPSGPSLPKVRVRAAETRR